MLGGRFAFSIKKDQAHIERNPSAAFFIHYKGVNIEFGDLGEVQDELAYSEQRFD
jgi:hypothetical protein